MTAPTPVASAPIQAVPVVEFYGNPTELGAEHGSRLGASVRMLQERYLKAFLGSDARQASARAAARGFERFISPWHLAEIDALAAAAEVSRDDVLLTQCFLDLQPSVGCSTIALPAGASPDGVARFGRNLDFPGLGVAESHSILLIMHPENRYSFAAVSWPGLIGVLSGMNEHGLCLANMEVDRKPQRPVAMPYTLLYRTILETCRTVDEAIALLGSTPRQTSNNLMLMDASGDRAVVEITPGRITVRRAAADQPLISTNHQRGQDLLSTGRCDRYDKLLAESQHDFGTLDIAAIERMLGSVVQGNMTMQSMVFEPATRTLYLATGANAPTHGYRRIELRPHFERGQ